MIKFIKLLVKRRQLSFCLGLAVAYGVDVVAVVCLDVPPAGGVVVGAVAYRL